MSFAPIQGLITNGGGVTLSPLVIEAGIFVLRSSRTNLYAGAGVTLAPLIGLAGALGGQNWFDQRLYGGRVRLNVRFSPQGDAVPGVEYLAGVRWEPSAVWRSPEPDQVNASDLNSNSILAEIGVGRRWYMSGRALRVTPVVLLGGTRFNREQSFGKLGLGVVSGG